MFWQVFFAVLAALIAFKFLSNFRRGFSERRQLTKTRCPHENYVLPNGESLSGFEISDYETDDMFLWDTDRHCEWRFAHYDGIESPRTWQPTDRDLASFLGTVRQIRLLCEVGEEDHGQFLIASHGTPNPKWLQKKDKSGGAK